MIRTEPTEIPLENWEVCNLRAISVTPGGELLNGHHRLIALRTTQELERAMQNPPPIVIDDTREGWAEAMEQLVRNGEPGFMNFDQVRPQGHALTPVPGQPDI